MSVLPACRCLSQTVGGTVRGKGDGVLAGANVMACKEDGKAVAYSITDGNGRFCLDIPKGESPIRITVSYLGFQTESIPFSQFRDGMTITLTEGTFKLREVTATSRRIKGEGDTLTYSVAGFRQKQDRSIADVLAKMPGIEVKADGKVEYQGKAISKFYIEGLDLMGSKYGVANRNISADKVLNVQVMRNHQPVNSLRGVSFSDQAALNIVLKDDAKAVWNGTADIGLGYGDELLYDSRLLGMCFRKTFQTLMMYKNNNTGKDIGAEVRDLTARYVEGVPSDDGGIVSVPTVAVPYLNGERYTFNRSHLVAGNWLWRTGRVSELRLQCDGLIDKDDMQTQSRTTYLTLADLPIVTEEQSLSSTRSEWNGEVRYQYNGGRTYILGHVKGYIDFNKSTGLATTNDTQTPMSAKPRRRSMSEQLTISHTTAAKNVYEVNSSFSYDYMPEQLLTLNGITERLELEFLSTQNALKNKLKVGRHYVNSQLGVDYYRQTIGVACAGEAGQSHAYQLLQPYWQPSLSFLFARHKLDAALRLSYAHQAYWQARTDEVWMEPSLRWDWQLSPMSEISASIRLDARPMMGKAIYDTPIFTGYRTQRTNLGELSTQQMFSVNMAYKYSNPIKGVFLNVRPIFSRTTGNLLYESSLDGGIYTLTATDEDYTGTTLGGTARFSKSFSWAKSVLGLSATYTMSDYSMLVSGDVDNARMQSIMSVLDYSLRPVRQLSMEGRTTMQLNRQQNLSHRELSSGSTVHWRHELDLNLFPSDFWMVTVSNELSHHSERSLGTDYFCDVSISYKACRWELSLTAGNLIGTSQYETRILGNSVETYSVTRLRPRECVVKWSFDI